MQRNNHSAKTNGGLLHSGLHPQLFGLVMRAYHWHWQASNASATQWAATERRGQSGFALHPQRLAWAAVSLQPLPTITHLENGRLQRTRTGGEVRTESTRLSCYHVSYNHTSTVTLCYQKKIEKTLAHVGLVFTQT